MFTGLEPKDRRLVKASLATAWGTSAAAGVTAILVIPNTIVAELGLTVTTIWGLSLVVSAFLATVGVALNKYTWEWVAAWFAIAGCIPYVSALWWTAIYLTPSRLTQALLATSLMLFFLFRALSCAAHARKLRHQFQATEGIGPTHHE